MLIIDDLMKYDVFAKLKSKYQLPVVFFKVALEVEQSLYSTYLLVKMLNQIKCVGQVIDFEIIEVDAQLSCYIVIKETYDDILKMIESKDFEMIKSYFWISVDGLYRYKPSEIKPNYRNDIDLIIFNPSLASTIEELILFSLVNLLNIKYRFGWINFMKADNDFSYKLYLRRIEVIQEYFRDLPKYELDSYLVLRSLSDLCEAEIAAESKGKHIYPGNNFMLALFLASALKADHYQEINQHVSHFCKHILDDFHHPLKIGNTAYLYQRFQSKKVHSFAYKGFDLVLSVFEPFYRKRQNLSQLFLLIISAHEDELMIKQAGLKTHLDIRIKAREAIDHPEVWELFEKECDLKNIRCGESLGLLCLTIMAYLLKDSFSLFKEIQKADKNKEIIDFD